MQQAKKKKNLNHGGEKEVMKLMRLLITAAAFYFLQTNQISATVPIVCHTVKGLTKTFFMYVGYSESKY